MQAQMIYLTLIISILLWICLGYLFISFGFKTSVYMLFISVLTFLSVYAVLHFLIC